MKAVLAIVPLLLTTAAFAGSLEIPDGPNVHIERAYINSGKLTLLGTANHKQVTCEFTADQAKGLGSDLVALGRLAMETSTAFDCVNRPEADIYFNK